MVEWHECCHNKDSRILFDVVVRRYYELDDECCSFPIDSQLYKDTNPTLRSNAIHSSSPYIVTDCPVYAQILSDKFYPNRQCPKNKLTFSGRQRERASNPTRHTLTLCQLVHPPHTPQLVLHLRTKPRRRKRLSLSLLVAKRRRIPILILLQQPPMMKRLPFKPCRWRPPGRSTLPNTPRRRGPLESDPKALFAACPLLTNLVVITMETMRFRLTERLSRPPVLFAQHVARARAPRALD